MKHQLHRIDVITYGPGERRAHAEFHRAVQIDDIVHEQGTLGELVRQMIEMEDERASVRAVRPDVCVMCLAEGYLGTEDVPHPIDGRLHTCVQGATDNPQLPRPDPVAGIAIPEGFGDVDQIQRGMRGLNQALRDLGIRADSGTMAALLLAARAIHGVYQARGLAERQQVDAYVQLVMSAWAGVTGIEAVVLPEEVQIDPGDPNASC